MIGLDKFPDEYFLKYSTKPIKIRPYNPRQKETGERYISKIKELLKNYTVDVALRGSTLFQISGKGEVEVGIYPEPKDWYIIQEILGKEFGSPNNIEKNYAQFNSFDDGIEVEIILLKEHSAEVDKKLHAFLLSHPDLLKKYEEVKKKYCFSKREYQIQKNKFLTNIIAQI